jgi:RimJ/RimL family protein N-acetyltransferase
MLDVANKYKDKIEELYYNTWYDDKYKFYFNSCWREKHNINDSNWNDINFISVDKDKNVLGLIGYQVDRGNDYVSCLYIINFSNNKITFGKDVGEVLDAIFTKFNFRKLEFSVVVGNSIEKSYDKLIHKYGGRIVGTYKQHTKLIDNKYYDEKFYEIFREDYLRNKTINKTEGK